MVRFWDDPSQDEAVRYELAKFWEDSTGYNAVTVDGQYLFTQEGWYAENGEVFVECF